MANSKGKVNPSAAQVHRPNLAQAKGNDVNYSRGHITGPAKSTEPAKAKKSKSKK